MIGSLAMRFHAVGTPPYQVCVAVTGGSLAGLVRVAETALAERPFVELRLDSLQPPLASLDSLEEALGDLVTAHPDAQTIATCRRVEAGGGFAGTPLEELRILEAAARAGCTLADLALESAEALGPDAVAKFLASLHAGGAGLIVSAHDFSAGGAEVEASYGRIASHRPDIVKLVTTAGALSDNLPLLGLLGRADRLPTVAIAMGEMGLLSRVLGPSRGSLFTFASAAAGGETAPGQLSAAVLRDLYRIDRIGPRTSVYGVAGRPIGQSLSPQMHNAAFALDGVDAVFVPLATDSAAELISVARSLPLTGISVTMPLKQAILPLLDSIDPLAARVGACNTVVRGPDGALHGHNTDVAGVVGPLARRLPLQGASILVRGAGGAARAAVFGLVEQGAKVWVTNRTPAAAAALAEEAGARVAAAELPAEAEFDALIHAIPSDLAESFGALNMSGERRIPARLVFDMRYSSTETALVRQARSQGLTVITGEQMLVEQGARQYELWTGRPAPETEMARAVSEALAARLALSERAKG